MKFSDNYGFSLPNKADRDSADIDVISENFELIDEILKNHEGYIGNNVKILDENEVTLETLPSEIPAGVTYCFVNKSNFVDGVWQVGLLVSYNSNRETDAYRVCQVWYGQLEDAPMQRKSQLSSGPLVWGEFKKYATKSDLTAVCVAKNQGASNVGKILVVGTDGNLTLADMPEGSSGDVIGVLDESNNILLSGNLADGTYTLKYENTDGTYTTVGTLEVGAIPTNFFIIGGDGYLNPGRASGNGADRTDVTGCLLSNYIAVQNGDVVYVEGMDIQSTGTSNSALYKENKTGGVGFMIYNNPAQLKDIVFSENGGHFTINYDGAAFIRINGVTPADLSAVKITIKRNGEWL